MKEYIEEYSRRLTSFDGAIRDAILSGLDATINQVGEITGDVNHIIDTQIPNVIDEIANGLESVVDKIYEGLTTLDVQYQAALTLGNDGNMYNDGICIDLGSGLFETYPEPILLWEFN